MFERSIDQPANPEHDAFATERHEIDLTTFTGLESKRGARRDVETMPIGPGAIELQVAVDLEKVRV